MLPIRNAVAVIALAGLLAGCAQVPSKTASLTTQGLPPTAVAAERDQAMPAPLTPEAAGAQAVASVVSVVADGKDLDKGISAAIAARSLTGRTIQVGSQADFGKLRPGEVVLTFDDGPDPAVTPKILQILDAYEVKAVFFMVGKMAKNHPKTAQLVASGGHTIGSHSHGHEKIPNVDYEAAMLSIAKSEAAINAALAPLGKSVSPFFRFPYMAASSTVSTSLVDAGWTIFSFDADSWDYLKQTPDRILKRTLKRLDAKGGGIVLFHDIHARTLDVLPGFLDGLKERGYKVVRVVPKNPNILTAAVPDTPS